MWRGTLGAASVAAALTAGISWPVLRSPGEQIFGHEIVGRHHDPFTVMAQMAGSGPSGPYLQPLTDGLGWLLVRVMDPVTAYNVLVLSTFPLTAAAVYLLARYLRAPHAAAMVASLLFTFSPMHLAHAAYHPHIAQTQWLPLYVLALMALIDRPSFARAAALAGACAALALSNFYGGLIGAVLSPVVLIAYWWASPHQPPVRHLAIAAATLAGLALAGIAIIVVAHPRLFDDVSAYATPASDVARYSARWWAYGVPSVSHAVFGPSAADVFVRADVRIELLEQQVFVSYAAALLAAIAAVVAVRNWRRDADVRPVLALLAIAAAAAEVSVGPISGACAPDSWAPACHLHTLVPMFRSYARFAFAVHLAIALAAGIALTWLWRNGRAGQVVAAGLVAVACFEYWPLPARARDTLPTSAHRWQAEDANPAQHTLDCTTPDLSDAYLSWLMQRRVSFLGPDVATCRDPYLGGKAAALGYTHVLVRRPDRIGVEPLLDDARSGLARVSFFPDASLYGVVAPAPLVVVLAEEGFHAYEYRDRDVWTWMAERGRWRVRNVTGRMIRVRLSADLEAIDRPRTLTVSLDGASPRSVAVAVGRASYTLGDWMIDPGDRTVVFEIDGAPFRPSDHGSPADDRRLTIAFRDRRWSEGSNDGAR